MDLKKILGKKAFISVFITNDRDMKKLNKEYLKIKLKDRQKIMEMI